MAAILPLQHYRCGAVIVNSTVNLIQQVIKAADTITDTIYLPLPLSPNLASDATCTKDTSVTRQNAYTGYLSNLFNHFRQNLPKLDVRVLLPLSPGTCSTPLSRSLEVVFSAYPDISQTEASPAYRIIAGRFTPPTDYLFHPDSTIGSFKDSDVLHVGSHQHVIVGGTFDHLHQGHYLLLAATILNSSSSCTVGVSTGPLLKEKVLKELLEPLEQRCLNVKELMEDMRPGLKLNIVPIIDSYGPTITDPELDSLVVSEETLKGGEAVNRKRLELGMSTMDMHKVPLIAVTDEKLSSTQQRKNQLGMYQEKVSTKKHKQRSPPYIIGLTGGTCSGKTSIATYLATKGAHIINCDRLGHEAYKPDTPAYNQLIERFGNVILSSNGTINTKILGGIVFSDKDQLNILNQIVWPVIAELIQRNTAAALQEGCRLCVLDAAVLLEAGWDEFVDEVWVAFVPEQEAISRLMQRNGLDEDTAKVRVFSQMSNGDKIARANVTFCSLWQREYTHEQVDSAWESLVNRMADL